MELVDPATPVDPMHCPTIVANGRPATPAVASPKTLTYVSLATVANVSPATAAAANPNTMAVQLRQSLCQELVPCQAQRLAFNSVDNPTVRRAHKVVLTMCCCYREPFLGDAVSKCHVLTVRPAITSVGQRVPAS